jgi:large subunit ribosomal protein L1
VAVIKDDLPDNVISDLVKNKAVELLSVEEVHQRIMTEDKKKIRKRTQWGFDRVVVHPQNEKKFKSSEKLPPKLFNLIARKVLLNENVEGEVEKFQKGEREIKTDRGGNIQTVIGKSDFSLEQLTENYQALYQKINSLKPPK